MSSPFKSNVVESSWKRLHLTYAARQAVISSLKIVFIFVLLYFDMSYSVFSGLVSVASPFVWFIELSFAILMLFKIISNGLLLCRYFWLCLFGSAIDITEDQSRLMALPLNSKTFKTLPRPSENSHSPNASLNISHSSIYGTMDTTTPLKGSPNLATYSPGRYQSPANNSSLVSPCSSVFTTPSLNSSYTASFNSSFDKSLNLSALSQSSGRYDFDRTSLRSRRSTSVPLSTSSSKYKHITDVETLHQYISEEQEKERNRAQASPESFPTGNISFWSFGSNPLDFAHIFRRFNYQLSPRSPTMPALNSSSDQISSQGIGEVWSKYGVTEDDLYVWIEKLRKWLSFTIISRLNAEIAEVNAALRKIGCDDTQVGEVGVSTLKQLALTKGNFVPTLNSVVSYLDFSANQEYLRNRIRDFSTGSMSAFSWDKGGDYGKPWNEHLPTDAALVMHFFCCYLDSRLPAQPKYPDGKSFTAQHFVKTPDKPNTDRKDNLQIYNSSINPPHFQVVIGSQIYNLSKGRNNMFQAILLFLYHIKVKEGGMLGRVNLGMSGLNMLWIFD